MKDNYPVPAGITDNKITDNKIGRDLVLDNSFKLIVPKVDPRGLLNLINRSKSLSEVDEEYRDFIDELNSLLNPRPGRAIIGLEEKLKNGGREDLIDDAIYLENKFAKRVAREQLSRVAQAVYLHCLSKINSAFSSHIQPLIRSGAKQVDIDSAIYKCIIEPIYEEVSVADTSVNMEMIRGMLFFLTGKCHAKWV